MRNSYDIIDELREGLVELFDLPDIDGDDKISMLTSMITFLGSKEYSKAELAKIILDYQYDRVSSFDRGLIQLFYKASKDNILQLTLAYPKIGTAFIEYGRESVHTLEELVNK